MMPTTLCLSGGNTTEISPTTQAITMYTTRLNCSLYSDREAWAGDLDHTGGAMAGAD